VSVFSACSRRERERGDKPKNQPPQDNTIVVLVRRTGGHANNAQNKLIFKLFKKCPTGFLISPFLRPEFLCFFGAAFRLLSQHFFDFRALSNAFLFTIFFVSGRRCLLHIHNAHTHIHFPPTHRRTHTDTLSPKRAG